MLEVAWEEWEESWVEELQVQTRDKEFTGMTTERQLTATMETEQHSRAVATTLAPETQAVAIRPVGSKLSLVKE